MLNTPAFSAPDKAEWEIIQQLNRQSAFSQIIHLFPTDGHRVESLPPFGSTLLVLDMRYLAPAHQISLLMERICTHFDSCEIILKVHPGADWTLDIESQDSRLFRDQSWLDADCKYILVKLG